MIQMVWQPFCACYIRAAVEYPLNEDESEADSEWSDDKDE